MRYEAEAMIISGAQTESGLRVTPRTSLQLRTPIPVDALGVPVLASATVELQGVDASKLLVGRFENLRARVTVEIYEPEGGVE